MHAISVPDTMMPGARHALVVAGYAITEVPGSPSQAPRYVLGQSSHRVHQAIALMDGLLTTREMQVLTGMAAGCPNGEIGRSLYLSEDTVKTHARRMFRKIGARDRAHAVAIGYQRGWLGRTAVAS